MYWLWYIPMLVTIGSGLVLVLVYGHPVYLLPVAGAAMILWARIAMHPRRDE